MKPTYEELEARCAALAAELKQSKIDADCYKKGMEASNARLVQIAAELSAIDAIHNDAVFITDAHYEQCPPEVQKIIGALAVLQIPAYKAFLAEARAQGVEMFAKHCQKRHGEMMKSDPNEAASNEAITATRRAGEFALYFAAQLRKGAQ